MRYFAYCIGGGPADGHTALLPGREYNTVVTIYISSPDGAGMIDPMHGMWGLYEYERTDESGDATTRVYRYVKSAPYGEAIAYSDEHGERR